MRSSFCQEIDPNMSVLYDQISKTLLPGMHIPEAIRLLFDWIETNGTYVDTKNGRIGFLFPEQEQKDGWTDTERPGGTDIEFAAEGNVNMKYWFRHEKPEVLSRLCVFAKTGGEGSMAAFWLDPAGGQKIVHLGSGSGSTLVCVLADDAVDFLRLLAIGYDEICWDEHFSEPPNQPGEMFIHPNVSFQNWVTQTFGVAIPSTAREIVLHPSSMDSEDSEDPFHRWVATMTE
jgi:hypothetical protein